MKKYIVTVAGTHQHINLKNSVEEFEDYQKAKTHFDEMVERLYIPAEKISQINEEFYTSIIGEDYTVSLDIVYEK